MGVGSMEVWNGPTSVSRQNLLRTHGHIFLHGILNNLFKAISLNEACVLVINHEYHEVQFVPQGWNSPNTFTVMVHSIIQGYSLRLNDRHSDWGMASFTLKHNGWWRCGLKKNVNKLTSFYIFLSKLWFFFLDINRFKSHSSVFVFQLIWMLVCGTWLHLKVYLEINPKLSLHSFVSMALLL